MRPWNVLVVGSGKLAKELLGSLRGESLETVLPWAERPAVPAERTLVIHAGSGRERPEVQAFCTETGATLVELASDPASVVPEAEFPLLVCANTNLLVLKVLAMIRREGGAFAGYERTLVESHQAAKTTEPGTALSLAGSLGLPASEIRSHRDPHIQQHELGIPAEHLARHAYHELTIRDGSTRLTLTTRVWGPSAYAEGLAEILRRIGEQPLKRGVHDVLDLF